MRLHNRDEIKPPASDNGLDIKCEKGTNLSYGPWTDRQTDRESSC